MPGDLRCISAAYEHTVKGLSLFLQVTRACDWLAQELGFIDSGLWPQPHAVKSLFFSWAVAGCPASISFPFLEGRDLFQRPMVSCAKPGDEPLFGLSTHCSCVVAEYSAPGGHLPLVHMSRQGAVLSSCGKDGEEEVAGEASSLFRLVTKSVTISAFQWK